MNRPDKLGSGIVPGQGLAVRGWPRSCASDRGWRSNCCLQSYFRYCRGPRLAQLLPPHPASALTASALTVGNKVWRRRGMPRGRETARTYKLRRSALPFSYAVRLCRSAMAFSYAFGCAIHLCL